MAARSLPPVPSGTLIRTLRAICEYRGGMSDISLPIKASEAHRKTRFANIRARGEGLRRGHFPKATGRRPIRKNVQS